MNGDISKINKQRGRTKGALGGITGDYKRRQLRILRKELRNLTEIEARDIKSAQIKDLQGRKLTTSEQRKINWFNKNIRPIVEKFIGGQGRSGRSLTDTYQLKFREMIENLTTGKKGPVQKTDIEILQYGIEKMLKTGFRQMRNYGDKININQRNNMLKAFSQLSSIQILIKEKT